MITEDSIVYESGDYWILKTDRKIFEVYRNTITHAEKIATIGYQGTYGLNRAIQVITDRQTE